MFRSLAIAVMLLASPAWSQTPSIGTLASVPGKPVAKRPASKTKAMVKPAALADSGPCQIGVIPAIGDKFVLKHIGLMVFGNELTEASVESWGLDDLAVTRVRAAASNLSVRRIAYARDAFDSYYHPSQEPFGDRRNDLVNVVRQIAARVNCDRYVVITRYAGQVAGTNQSASGMGVLTNAGSSTFKTASLFAFVGITVFDGKTFAKHDPYGSVGARLTAGFSNMLKDDAFRGLRDFEVPATPEAVVGDGQLRDGARAMLSDKLDQFLPRYLNRGNDAQ
jgi:hypothetical protein